MLLSRITPHRLLTSSIALSSYRLRSSIVQKQYPSISRTVTVDMETVNTTERLNKLRDLMKENKIDVYSMKNERSWDLPCYSCVLSRTIRGQPSIRVYCSVWCPSRSDQFVIFYSLHTSWELAQNTSLVSLGLRGQLWLLRTKLLWLQTDDISTRLQNNLMPIGCF